MYLISSSFYCFIVGCWLLRLNGQLNKITLRILENCIFIYDFSTSDVSVFQRKGRIFGMEKQFFLGLHNKWAKKFSFWPPLNKVAAAAVLWVVEGRKAFIQPSDKNINGRES